MCELSHMPRRRCFCQRLKIIMTFRTFVSCRSTPLERCKIRSLGFIANRAAALIERSHPRGMSAVDEMLTSSQTAVSVDPIGWWIFRDSPSLQIRRSHANELPSSRGRSRATWIISDVSSHVCDVLLSRIPRVHAVNKSTVAAS
jgi:hypothetical protein